MENQKKKITHAAALRYSPDENTAPEVVALGKGEVAEKILAAAKENDIPVYTDASLAQALTGLQLGDEIPRDLYEAVAEILFFVSQMDKKFGARYGEYDKQRR